MFSLVGQDSFAAWLVDFDVFILDVSVIAVVKASICKRTKRPSTALQSAIRKPPRKSWSILQSLQVDVYIIV